MPHTLALFLALFLVIQDFPSVKAIDSTFQTIIYFGVEIAIVILAIGLGLQWIIKALQKLGIKFGGLSARQEYQSETMKRVGDLTVESLEAKMRHAVRGEMQPVVMSFKELKDSNSEKLDAINSNLIRLVTLEEMRGKA